MSQKVRLLILFLYIGILLAANHIAFQQLLPINGAKGLWFYSGFASLLLGNLLVTPYFTKPVDAISYAVVAMIALYSVNDWDKWILADQVAFSAVLLFSVAVVIIGFLTILTKDNETNRGREWSNTFRILSDFIGNETIVFSSIILFALIVFHRQSATEMFVITLAWVITVVIKPDQHIIALCSRIKKIWQDTFSSDIIGDVAAYQTPNIALVRQRSNNSVQFGEVVIFRDPHAPTKVGVALDYVGRDESLLLRTMVFDVPGSCSEAVSAACRLIPENTMGRCAQLLSNSTVRESIPIFNQLHDFVGIVTTETSIETLYFEVVKEANLEEGKLVQVSIKGDPVLYQVIEGFTKEEVVFQKNTFGFARAKAQKIGAWDEREKKFNPAKWIPSINAPVFLKSMETCEPDIAAIGHFPGSSYNVRIKSVSHLVTHNTAILGILGVGKSMLSIELVERMIAENVKVICLDLTNQYAQELSGFYNAARESVKEERLVSIGIAGEHVSNRNIEEGGSINQFAVAIEEDLREFVNDASTMLKIYNPAKFNVWRQSGGQFQGNAAMASLTPTEIAKIVSEAALKIAQEMGMSDSARICLVYEEAHSLVPEWNSIAADGDKAATNGTARAILQGRKYGLGCLLITQRTANVTKTILNQCNTIFAMRTFDETGKDFLANYIGNSYSGILSSLEERHAVFFGKASSCDNPVLIRLNDRDEFRERFRKASM